jgi:hypothetical protein
MNSRIVIALAAALAAGAVNLAAQPSEGPGWMGPLEPRPGPSQDIMYFNLELGPGGVVKNAPYSAETATEFTQVLADGNRINRKQAGLVYRDSEGRTRREQTIGPIGLLPADSEPKRMVFISDPVAGVNYALDPVKKTAEKMPLPRISHLAGPGEKITNRVHVIESDDTVKHSVVSETVTLQHVRINPADAGAPTKLGARAFDGVQADGTRLAISIPAGQMGNERPIEIVDERWYSPQLQAMVMTRHTDPRMGETVYQLSNISLAEPAHSLFEVPADYQVVEPRTHMEILKK